MNDATKTIGGTLSLPALFHWAAALFKSPRDFFRGMERKGGYVTPCLYLAAWSFVSGVTSFLVGITRPVPAAMVGGRAGQALAILLSPVAVLIVAFFAAAVLFVIWHLMGSKEDYQTAFRVWAFMAPVGVLSALLGIVPFLPILSMMFSLYLIVLASQEVHGVSPERSWAVWGVLGVIVLVFLVVAFMVSAAARSGRIPGMQGAFSAPRFPR